MKTVTLAMLESIRSKRGSKGFTLLELLMVSAILAVLVAIAVPMWPVYQNLARSTRAMREIRQIETAIEAFHADQGRYPGGLNEIGYGAVKDPWGHLYIYDNPPTRTHTGDPINNFYDLYSEGADGTHEDSIVASPDDIILSGDGQSVGLADRYGPS